MFSSFASSPPFRKGIVLQSLSRQRKKSEPNLPALDCLVFLQVGLAAALQPPLVCWHHPDSTMLFFCTARWAADGTFNEPVRYRCWLLVRHATTQALVPLAPVL